MVELLRLFRRKPEGLKVSETFSPLEQSVLHYFNFRREEIVSLGWAQMSRARLRSGKPLLKIREYVRAIDSLTARGFLAAGDDEKIEIAKITERGKKAARIITNERDAFLVTVTVLVPTYHSASLHA